MSRVQSIERAFAVLGALATARSASPTSPVASDSRSPPPPGCSPRSSARAPSSRCRASRATGSGRGSSPSRPASARPRGLVAIAHPTLVALAGELGEAAGLSVPDGRTVHYVDQVDSPNPVQVRDWTGTRIPMHAVSSGQVFLAHLSAPALARFLADPLEPFTSRTLTDAGALLDRLRDVRRDGHAWVREEFAEGISSAAAPVAGARRRDRRRGPRPRAHVPLPGRRFGGRGRRGRARCGSANRSTPSGRRVSAGHPAGTSARPPDRGSAGSSRPCASSAWRSVGPGAHHRTDGRRSSRPTSG